MRRPIPTIGRIASGKTNERDEREQPILIEHDADQKDDGHRVLADPASTFAAAPRSSAASLVKREIRVPVGLAWK